MFISPKWFIVSISLFLFLILLVKYFLGHLKSDIFLYLIIGLYGVHLVYAYIYNKSMYLSGFIAEAKSEHKIQRIFLANLGIVLFVFSLYFVCLV